LIPQDFISEWKKAAPWSQNDQVEQDLIICRALVEIFSDPILADNLAFRGGTALFKLHLQPVRYSEDIDLVQVKPGRIGPILDALQKKLNPWLGKPKRKQTEGRVTLTYRVASEEGVQLSLKVEINSREHFTVLGFDRRGFSVDSRWFSGTASILTYHLDELLGKKVRALYQRKKGRDLFDLWAASTIPHAQPERVIACFLRYLDREGRKVSRAEFERNLYEKLGDPRFIADIEPLVVPDSGFDLAVAADFVLKRLAILIPGEPWKGKTSGV
jgi:predicted nucleotidyltransferase component of viral defense system